MREKSEGGRDPQRSADDIDADSKLTEAIRRTTQEVGLIRKEQPSGLQYSVLSDAAVIAAIRGPMSVNGLVLIQQMIWLESHKVIESTNQRNQRRMTAHAVVRVGYELRHECGASVCCESIGEAMDTSDKAVAKALTMARKSLFRTLFLIESDDPDLVRHEPAAPAEPAPF